MWAAALEGAFVSLVLVLRRPHPGSPTVSGLLVGPTVALTVFLVALSIVARLAPRPWLRVVAVVERLAGSDALIRLLIAVFYLSILVNIVALFGVSLRLNPDANAILQTFLNRGLWPLVWLSLLTLHAVAALALFSGAVRRWVKEFLVGASALALLVLYWYGAEGQLLYFNVDMRLTDQSAYMEYARLLRQSGYTYPGDFNRMPVYPFLLSLVWREGMTDAQFFQAAKYFNLFLSMPLLAVLAVLFLRRFTRLLALDLLLITAFSVFIYKAGWVQAELLFYVLNAVLFLLIWRLLTAPTFAAAVAAGIVAGLAHLTKASIWPSLALFGVLGLWRGAWLWRRGASVPRRSAVTALLVVPVSAAVFLAVIFPYLRLSQRITGHAFYNVNSSFYMWYDSWEQAEAGTKAHGDRVGWPDLPPEAIPSPAKYWREHTLSQMATRLIDGGRDVMEHVLHSYGYIDYVVVYAGVLVVAAALNRRKAWESIRGNAFLFAFVVGYFPLYVLLYFWYAPIAAGDRLILAQLVPLLMALSAGWQAQLRDQRLDVAGRSISWLTALGLAVLVMAGAGAFRALTSGVYVLRGGG